MIENCFSQTNPESIVFDPVPSFDGDWFFEITNLKINAKVQDGQNLWEEFYQKTYITPLEKIFKSKVFLELNVGMVSTPNKNNIGRCLKYSKDDFYSGLINFLNQNVDTYGLTEDEKKARTNKFVNYTTMENDELNMAFSDAFKEKLKRLKELSEKEFMSDYFEAAMSDYTPFKSSTSFTEYLQKMIEKTEAYQKGLIVLSDFFDRPVDSKELFHAFDPDTFYLLFAKIILEYNKNYAELQSNFRYLGYYKCALDNVTKEDNDYNPKIVFYLSDGSEVRYTCWDFINELEVLAAKHPELGDIKLPNLNESEKEKYKDISLMKKLSDVSKNNNNFTMLQDNEKIVRGKNIQEKSYLVNMRIGILEKSGYIGKIFKGNNLFMGYYAFVYQNGLVVIEKFWEDLEGLNPNETIPTIILNIDDFINLSLTTSSIEEYAKSLPTVKRIYHTSINNWQRCLYDEINGKYRLEDALNFTNDK